ncbi:dehydrogenase/reductase SDR family member 7 [Fistulifera solaris]|uniref:Dehydrogenase/reductase SDR family member 7 n=1 Tax=Fistulifera solaris TaxID=1519565 RepID=A0A1Z5JN40_FISSO|nr:dehydrogenase/reductase SDR family member 7 [Fistulifera solaris]|eukprot:GAX15425.1 dehydrogenase/reductase SDR family member 7 [Fistulifera solaris]
MFPWLWIIAAGWTTSILDCSPSMYFYEKWNRLVTTPSRSNNKTLWIIGASSGIGKEVALLQPTSQLILSSRSKRKLQQVAVEFSRKTRHRSENMPILLPFDITLPRQVRRAIRQLPARVDAVWINAGVGGQLSTVEGMNPSYVRQLFETNTLGPMRLIQLLCQERPDIRHFIVTSSVAGHLPVPLSSAYAASKHALHGFLKSLTAEQPQLRVDVLCPGTVDTPFHPRSRATQSMKMSATRCAHIVTAAMRRKRPRQGYNEVWIARQPTLSAMYLYQWFPTITQAIISRYAGPKRVSIWKHGLDVYDPCSWKTKLH